MSNYDAIIIGAGNAGLVSATSLARAGLKTLLLERHNIPGGCATSFIRGRFEFEVSLHQLSGIGSEATPGPLRKLLAELGALEKLNLVEEHDIYRAVAPGVDVTIPADLAAAQTALGHAFPAEKLAIGRFFQLMEQLVQQVRVFPGLATNAVSADEAQKIAPEFLKYALKNTKQVVDELFQSEPLKYALTAYWSYIGVAPSQVNFASLALMLWDYMHFKPFHLKGGSQALSNALFDSYLEAGGEAQFNCGAAQILVKGGEAYGVVSEDGKQHLASHIVCNASPLVAYTQLIDPEQVPQSALDEFATRKLGTSFATLHMGLDCNPEDLGINASTTFISSTLDEQGHQRAKSLEPPTYACVSCYDVGDPEFSPQGSCQVAALALQYCDPWVGVPPEQYARTKYHYGDQLLKLVETAYPGIRDVIEEVEVATPLTHMRYLGHPGGAVYGFEQNLIDNSFIRRNQSVIKNLHFAGAWSGMGGYEPTLTEGRATSTKILRKLDSRGKTNA